MAGLYSITTRDDGTVLTAAIYMADHQNHVDNLSINMMGISYTDAGYDATTEPQSGGSRSKPTHLQGQLERLAYAIHQLKQSFGLTVSNWWNTFALTGAPSSSTFLRGDGSWQAPNVSDSVTNITGNTTITAAQMTGRVRFYNSAQAAITLPAATTGLTALFEINHSGGIRFIRNGTDTFTCGGTASLTAMPVGGGYDIVVGGIYELTCYVTGVWIAKRKGVQPAVEVTKNADQTGIPDGIPTKVTWQTEVRDTNGEFASSTYSPVLPGELNFDVKLAHSGQSDGSRIGVHLYKNGSLLDGYIRRVGSTFAAMISQSFKDWTDGNDTYDIYVYLAGGGGSVLQVDASNSERTVLKISRTPD